MASGFGQLLNIVHSSCEYDVYVSEWTFVVLIGTSPWVFICGLVFHPSIFVVVKILFKTF